MYVYARRAVFGLAAMLWGVAAHPAIIEYLPTNIAADTWRYDYVVRNDSLGAALREFTIFFEVGRYTDLNGAIAPAGWDPFIGVVDPSLPDAGFVDFLALGQGIPANGTLGGYSIQFTWLSEGIPGEQPFAVIDPVTFITLESGLTQLRAAPPTQVPEPASLLLFMAALIGITVGMLSRRLTVRWRSNA